MSKPNYATFGVVYERYRVYILAMWTLSLAGIALADCAEFMMRLCGLVKTLSKPVASELRIQCGSEVCELTGNSFSSTAVQRTP